MLHRCFAAVMLISCTLGAGGETQSEPPDRDPALLTNGLNYLDFTGDKVNDLVVVGHRENFNAHSFEVISLYTHAAVIEGTPAIWQIVPIFKRDGKEVLQIIVSGGADCALRDFRLLPKSRTLIIAERDLGDSFGESHTVTFTRFKLVDTMVENESGEPGRPAFSFEEESTIRTEHKYCDVGDAFRTELGIPHAWPGTGDV